ncbi:MAG: TonB-dependent receptor [Myxococcota bacterium]
MSCTLLSLALAAATSFVGSGESDAKEEATEDSSELDDLDALSLESLLDVSVETATQLPQDSWSAPATVYVFTERMIQNRGYTSLIDILADVPEIEIQRNSQVDVVNSATIRGLSSNPGNEKFTILLDGFRITPATSDYFPLARQFSIVGAKRVEVVMGPASALYGPDAVAGVINIITKDGSEADKTRVGGGYGQYATGEAFATGGARLADLIGVGDSEALRDVRVSGTAYYYRSNEPRLPREYPEEYAWFRERYRQDGSVRVSPFAPEEVTTTVPVRAYNQDRHSAFGHLRLNIGELELGFVGMNERHSSSLGIRPEFSLYWEETKLETTLTQFYIRHLFEGTRFSIESSATYQRNQLEPDSAFINAFSLYESAFKYFASSVFTARERLTVSLTPRTTLLAGVMLRSQQAIARTADLPTPFSTDLSADEQNFFYPGSDIVDAEGRSLAIPQDVHRISYVDTGVYAQLVAQEIDWVDLTLGARFDNSSRYGQSFNPRAAIVLKPRDDLRLKLLYGEAFLAPSPNRTYQHFGSFVPVTDAGGDVTGLQSFFFFLPNSDLSPERFRSGEVSLSWNATEHLRFSTQGYFTRTTDLIQLADVELDGEFKNTPVDAIQRFENGGNSETYGGTFQANFVQSFGELDINAYAAYSYTDGEFLGRSLGLTSRDAVKAGVELEYRLGFGRINFFPRVIWRSGGSTFVPDGAGGETEIENDSYTLVTLFAQYVFPVAGTEVGVFARVNNALDSRFFNVANSTDDAFLLTPQDPIRAIGGAWIAL